MLGGGETEEDRRLVLDSIKPKTPKFIYVITLMSAIGGFLFGYDTGVVSGAMILLKEEFTLTSTWHELIVSATIAAAWLFSIIAGIITDVWGRKPVIILASFVFTVGAVLMGAALNRVALLGGRIIVGIGIGLASMTVPMYIGEVAPPNIRGRLVTINNCFIAGGQFVASVIDGIFSKDKENGWRYMLGLAAIPSFVQFFGFLVMPESPRWLINRGCYQDAVSVLRRIRGQTANVEEEFEAIKSNCLEIERERQTRGQGAVIIQVLKSPPLRRALLVGCALQVFQQVAGINTVMYYSATIIEMSGVKDKSKAIWLACATSATNFICTFIGLALVERVGRRLLTLFSLTGVIISLSVLAIGFQLADKYSPVLTNSLNDNSTCSKFEKCGDCVNSLKCGYCFWNREDEVNNGTCLPVNTDNVDMSSTPPCNSTHLEDPVTWAYEWCPSKYSWMTFFGLLLYLVCFAPGMGPMPWTINSEIYPLWARSTCYSTATSANWFFNFIVSMTFLTFTEKLTKYGTFWMYATISLVGLIFFFLMLPETKGKSLEEVEGLFSYPWWQDATTIDDKKTVQDSKLEQPTDISSLPASD